MPEPRGGCCYAAYPRPSRRSLKREQWERNAAAVRGGCRCLPMCAVKGSVQAPRGRAFEGWAGGGRPARGDHARQAAGQGTIASPVKAPPRRFCSWHDAETRSSERSLGSHSPNIGTQVPPCEPTRGPVQSPSEAHPLVHSLGMRGCAQIPPPSCETARPPLLLPIPQSRVVVTAAPSSHPPPPSTRRVTRHFRPHQAQAPLPPPALGPSDAPPPLPPPSSWLPPREGELDHIRQHPRSRALHARTRAPDDQRRAGVHA